MEKVKYNNYSKTLKKLAGSLPHGTSATFVLLTKKLKRDVEGETKYDHLVGIGPTRVPNECMIIDPETQEPVQIGYVVGVNPDGSARLGDIVFYDTDGGEKVCIGGKTEDMMLAQYLRLCLWNETRPLRDSNRVPIFKEINPVAEEEEEGRKKGMLARAMGIFSAMSSIEKRKFCEQHGLAHIGTDLQIDARMAKYIEEHTETFINLMDDSSHDILTKINIAKDAGVIRNNYQKAQWEWADQPKGEGVIMKYVRDFGRSGPVDKKLLDWIMGNPKGMDVFRQIEAKLEEVEV